MTESPARAGLSRFRVRRRARGEVRRRRPAFGGHLAQNAGRHPSRCDDGRVPDLEMTTVIKAPRGRVYRALVDPADVAQWRFPRGMTCEVHEFDAREGGRLRVSLTYESTDRAGKTRGSTDTYHGRFVR